MRTFALIGILLGILSSPGALGLAGKTVLQGKIILNPDRSTEVNPRYEGLVRQVSKSVGDQVSAGERLAVIESNVGLQTYPLISATAGTVLHRNLVVGEYIEGTRTAFEIADIKSLWVRFVVRRQDLSKIRQGTRIKVRAAGGKDFVVEVFYVSSTLDQHTETAFALASLDNGDLSFRPGQFVEGNVLP